jgi:hypothetical protein
MDQKVESQFPMREAFLQELKNYSLSDHPSEVYRHIFSCMEADSLESLLRNLKSAVGEEDWFFYFHKSMRQTDSFGDTIIVAKAYGKSESLGVESRGEEDSRIITRQITNVAF